MNQYVKTSLGILVILIIAGIAGFFMWKSINTKNADVKISEIQTRVCTQEARQCSDGSYVSRTRPNCEFEKCPTKNIVGNDRDEHGCIGSAGYSWCEAKQKCLRVWEESCDVQSGLVYKNTEYGFQISIPKGYENYKAMIEKNYGGEGITYIYILFKTKDKNIVTENFVSHEKYPGYESIFAFTAWEIDVYNEMKEQCKNNPGPDCPSEILGQNEKYVIDVQLGNGVPPSDLADLREMLDNSDDIGKALDFKILD